LFVNWSVRNPAVTRNALACGPDRRRSTGKIDPKRNFLSLCRVGRDAGRTLNDFAQQTR
jgi:hypothetical protein